MASGTETQLERTLGFKEALMIGVGTMIGAGIFVLPGAAAGLAGPGSSIAFVAAGAIAMLTALSASELATAMPASGGPYHFINKGLGPLFGSIAGLGNWLGLAFATAFYAVGFGNYVDPLAASLHLDLGVVAAVPLSGPQIGGLAAATAFIALNYLSTDGTGDLQNVIVIVLLGILGAFIALGATQVQLSEVTPIFPQGSGPGAVLPTTALVFVSYLGFAQVATVAGEIKEPGKNLPRAMVGGVVLVTTIYAVSMLILLGVVPLEAVAGEGTAIAIGARAVFGGFGIGVIGVGLLTFGGLLATASSANASVLSASRINYAMGRDGLMDTRLSEIHDRYNTPYRSIVLTGALILVFIVAGRVNALAKAGSVLHLLVYGLLNVSLIVMRETDATGYDPSFAVPAYPVVPALGALLSFALIGFMDPQQILLAGGLVVGGIVWYFVYVRKRIDDTSALARYRSPPAVEVEVDVDFDIGAGDDAPATRGGDTDD
ncbi:amino acid transporter [Halobellus salinus]|uniref:Amino acid transporter n=1 Tax=Halobellus salinus TaxID=931585 RepID=A0A830EB76_9EURY|nr:amino acid permease [Halobellus salinus]GGJ07651.1 amino acid transporter [Halobellus salinus]SMP26381.1 amino acid/polyamine/organocation transporter, APC superfamily [Halobellus salinus]